MLMPKSQQLETYDINNQDLFKPIFQQNQPKMTDDSYYEPYHYNIRESQDEHGKAVHIKITPNSSIQEVILKQTTLIKKLKDQRNRYISTIEERNFIITQMVEKMKQYEGRIQVLSNTIVEVLGQDYLNGLFDKESLQKLSAAKGDQINKIKELKKNNEQLRQEIRILRQNRQQVHGDEDNLLILEKIRKENESLTEKLQNMKKKYKRVKAQMKQSKNLVNEIQTIQIEEETVQMYQVQCQTENQIRDEGQIVQAENKVQKINKEINNGDFSEQKQEMVLNKQERLPIQQNKLEDSTHKPNIEIQINQFEPETIKIKQNAQPAESALQKDQIITNLKKQIQELKNSTLESAGKVQSSLPAQSEVDLSEKDKTIHDLKKQISKLKKKEKQLQKLKVANQKLTSDLETLQFEEEAVQLYEVECQTQFEIEQKQVREEREDSQDFKDQLLEKNKIIEEINQIVTTLQEQAAQKQILSAQAQRKNKADDEYKQGLIRQLNSQKSGLNDQIQLLISQRIKDCDEIEAKKQKIDSLEFEIAALKQQIALKNSEMNSILAKVEPKASENQVQDKQVQAEIQEPKVDVQQENKNGIIQELKKQIYTLKEQVSSTIKERDQAFEETQAKNKIIEQLEQEASAFKAQAKIDIENSDQIINEEKSKVNQKIPIQLKPEPQVQVAVEEEAHDQVEVSSEKDQIILALQKQIAELKQFVAQSSVKIQNSPQIEIEPLQNDDSEKEKVIQNLKKEISKLKKKEKQMQKLKAANEKLTSDLEALQFEEEVVQLFEVECQTQLQFSQVLVPLGTQTNNQASTLLQNSSQPQQVILNLQQELSSKNNKIAELQTRINFLNRMIIQLREQSDSILKNLAQNAPVLDEEVNFTEKIKQNENTINKLKSEIDLRQKYIKQTSEGLQRAQQFLKWVSTKSGIQYPENQNINSEESIQKLKQALSNVIEVKKTQKQPEIIQDQVLQERVEIGKSETADVVQNIQDNGQFLAIAQLDNIPLLYIEKIYENPTTSINFEPIFISHENMRNPPQPFEQIQSSEPVELQSASIIRQSPNENEQNAKKMKSRPNLSIQIQEQKPFKLPLMLAPASPKNTINFSPLLTRTEPYYNRNTATQTEFLISNLKTVEKWKLQNLLRSSIKKINTVLSQLESAPAVKEKNIREIANNVGNQSLCQFFNNQGKSEKKI